MFPIRDHNPSEKVAYVTYTLMALNIGIWLWGLMVIRTTADQQWLYQNWAMVPAFISEGHNLHGLVTSTFLHAGFMHLAGNMLFLWIFGDNLEEELGHVGFLLFYLAAGVGASLAQWAADTGSGVPTVGASGAIAGIMGAYLLFFPKAKVDVLIFIVIFIRVIPVPAWVMLGLWFALQLFNGVASTGVGGGVAYWAHAGGFVVGLILALPAWMKKGAGEYWERTEGHPPHPEATYPFEQSRVPRVPRRK